MARNVAYQEGQPLNHFSTAVFDLLDLGEDLTTRRPKTRRGTIFGLQDVAGAYGAGWRRKLLYSRGPPSD